MNPRVWVFGLILPALAGGAAGWWLGRPAPTAADAASEQRRAAVRETLEPLPDDPGVVRLAALAGRTKEAREELARRVAAGAKDEEIANLLATVLLADPAWLETFIVTVPEERRLALVRTTFGALAKLRPDSVWDLLLASPFAVHAVKPHPGDRDPTLQIPFPCLGSARSADLLFDPVLGFTPEQIARRLSGWRGVELSRRVMEEWQAGLWGDETPQCIKNAWWSLRLHDPEELERVIAALPEALRKTTEDFDLLAAAGEAGEPPPVELLTNISPQEIESLAEDRAMAGEPLPLATLAQLSPEAREAVLPNYWSWFYPFDSDDATRELENLDRLGFTPAERGLLLEEAAREEWWHHGDYDRARELAERIPDAKARGEFTDWLDKNYAELDPHGAMARADGMPPGPERERLLKLAEENMP